MSKEKTLLRLHLFGIPRLEHNELELSSLPMKLRALLCYLAVQAQVSTREELAEVFWQVGKTNSVRQALYQLKSFLGEDVLDSKKNLVSLATDSDAKHFEQAFKQENYQEAVQIWQQAEASDLGFLKGIELKGTPVFDDWLEQKRHELKTTYEKSLKHLAQTLETQSPKKAIQHYKQLLQQDSLNETIHRTIMRLEHEQGNTEAALQQFEECINSLKDLGASPSQETLNLLGVIEAGGTSGNEVAYVIRSLLDIPHRPDHLFGRERLLEDIEKQANQSNHVLLQGFGGMGKTSLAAELVARSLVKGLPALWLQVGKDGPDSLMDSMAKALGAQANLRKAQDKPKALHELLLNQKISLLVLDDVWNAYTLYSLLEFLPEKITVIITSRHRYPKLKRTSVGELSREASLQLLRHTAGKIFNNQWADKLCERLGDHAFTIRLAGLKLALDELTPQALLNELTDKPHMLSIPANFSETGRETIAKLLEASLEDLPDEAYDVFMAFGSLFVPNTVPELLARCLRRQTDEVEHALYDLQNRGLASRLSDPGSDIIRYQIHDLSFSFVKANTLIRKQTVIRSCLNYAKNFTQQLGELEAVMTNLLAAAQHAFDQRHSKVFIDLMVSLTVDSNYFSARGHTPLSLKLLSEAATTAETLAELETAHFLMTKLGNGYFHCYADTEKALTAYKQARHFAKVIKNTNREAILLGLIGSVQFDSNKEQALHHLDEAYHLAKASKDDFTLGHILQNRSYVAFKAGLWQDMQRYASEAVDVAHNLNKQNPDDKSKVNTSLFYGLINLGEAQQRLGHLQKAKDARQEALEVAEDAENKLWQAHALQELADVHHHLNNKPRAKEYYTQSLKLYQLCDVKTRISEVKTIMQERNYTLEERVN